MNEQITTELLQYYELLELYTKIVSDCRRTYEAEEQRIRHEYQPRVVPEYIHNSNIIKSCIENIDHYETLIKVLKHKIYSIETSIIQNNNSLIIGEK